VVPEKSAAFSKKWGIPKPASDLDDLINNVDAVSVVTPDQYHFEPAMKTLQAGKHLLTEKPLTTTLAHARLLHRAASAAAKKGVIHMINFSYRNASAVSAAADIVKKGKLGRLRHVHSHYLQSWIPTKVWGHWTDDWCLWRQEKGSGGVLTDIGCHILDLTTSVAGDATKIRCHLANFPKILKGKEVTRHKGRNLDANDTALLELLFANGAVGTIHASRWATGLKNHLRCEVHGTEGALKIDLDEGPDQLGVCLEEDIHTAKWEQRKLKPILNNHERFIQAILTGKQAQPDVTRGAHIQAYLETCLKSAKSGKWEKVPSI